ncbi:nardilysin [Lepeophtheirus salmonis]|uniref:nardilysin n=1 Tax=Lepeophtheirus salmonis TaxID=72036 RepID=UPI001AE9C1AA|nr:nardilysin-like [Lepeophtheirus salmonis]
MTVQNLETPESSYRDLKEYRTIKLNNGLRVLLIADTRVPLDKLEKEENGSVEDGDGENNLKKSTASLCVGMGSFSDLECLPGIAHFLEHMVFMGSAKYTDESDFSFFIANHGGTYNAFTMTESTVFYFDIQRNSFYQGLDRLAQFFTSPLLKKESMTREREAVDSESLMAIQSDDNKKEILLGSLSKDKHPMGKFFWGNIDSLSPKDMDDESIHKLLVKFKDRHYSAQYMTLVIQSQDTLDNLQKMVEELFSNIPNNGLEQETFDHLKHPFDTKAFNQIYKIVPIENSYRLEINWALAPLIDKFRVKPIRWLSWIIGHEGKGSLIAYLREKNLALDLFAGNSGYGFSMNSTCSLFSIGIELTESGFNNYEHVIKIVYSYLSMLKEYGPVEHIFDEIQKIEQLDFDLGKECSPIDNVQTICQNMQFLPPKRYLDGDKLMFEFDKTLIKECLDHLFDTSNVNIMLSGKEFSNLVNKVEPWFKTKYFAEEITSSRLDQWKSLNPSLSSFFHLPEENKFIPHNTEIISGTERNAKHYPLKIISESHGELFYKKDEIFKLPRAMVYLHFCSDLFNEKRPENSVCLDLMVDYLEQLMKEDTYAADIAKLTFSLTSCEKGMTLQIIGFNDKLNLLLTVIMDHINTFESRVSKEKFNAIKELTKKNYFNTFTKASKLVRDLRLSLLQDCYIGAQMRHSIIDSIDLEVLTSFSKAFKSKLYIQGLVQGNISKSDALEVFKISSAISDNMTSIPKETCCMEIPKGEKRMRMKGVLPSDNNTFVTNYYQYGPGDLKMHALFELLCMVMDEPVFDILRTKEQLGYFVFSVLRNTQGVLGIEVTVNSQENKYKVDFVEERIEAFLKEFYNKEISNMDDLKFAEYLKTMIKKKKTADVTLEEEMNRNWKEIISRDYLFERNKLQASLYENNQITLSDLKEIVKQMFLDVSTVKKLSVQVIGVDKKIEEESLDELSLLNKKHAIELQIPSQNNELFIQDLSYYKTTLIAYPVTHISE